MCESVSAQWTPRLCFIVSVHPYSEKESSVPSIQWAWCMCVCVWVGKQTADNQQYFLQLRTTRAFLHPHLASSVSPARSVYTESCWAQRTRPLITKWSAAALQFYIHTTAPRAFNIDGPASSEDFRVILLSWLCFSFCKMSGGEIICQGWLRKSPPEKKLRRYVSVSNAMFFWVIIFCFMYSNSDAESCA